MFWWQGFTFPVGKTDGHSDGGKRKSPQGGLSLCCCIAAVLRAELSRTMNLICVQDYAVSCSSTIFSSLKALGLVEEVPPLTR